MGPDPRRRKIGKALLSGVNVSVLFVAAYGIQGLRTEDADDGAEDVHLLIVDFHEFSKFSFNVLNSPSYGREGQTRR